MNDFDGFMTTQYTKHRKELHLCPKCGSEMMQHPTNPEAWRCVYCGRESNLKDGEK